MARRSRVVWKVALLEADMAKQGWGPALLANQAGLAVSTVTRFLAGTHRTPKAAKRMAMALGHPVARYVRDARGETVAA